MFCVPRPAFVNICSKKAMVFASCSRSLHLQARIAQGVCCAIVPPVSASTPDRPPQTTTSHFCSEDFLNRAQRHKELGYFFLRTGRRLPLLRSESRSSRRSTAFPSVAGACLS